MGQKGYSNERVGVEMVAAQTYYKYLENGQRSWS